MEEVCDRFAALSRKDSPGFSLKFKGDQPGAELFVAVTKHKEGFELRVDEVLPEFRVEGGVKIKQHSPVRHTCSYNEHGFFMVATSRLASESGFDTPVYPYSYKKADQILQLVAKELQATRPKEESELSSAFFSPWPRAAAAAANMS